MSGPPLPDFDAQPLCAEADPEAFFPEVGVSTRPAKAICARCELQEPCLAYAIEWNVSGVWGGTSEKQRRAIRNRRGIVAHNLTSSQAEDRREAVRRMHKRGTEPVDIARTLGVTQEAVQRILRDERGAA